VPTISRFYGILIQMYFDDHNPPHFHVIYADHKAVIGIYDFGVLEGDLPPRALGLVTEWARINKDALLEDWDRARRMEALLPIKPLE